MDNEALHNLLEEYAAKLAEHVDAVQISVSWTENGNTWSMNRGRGNWYARQGLAHEFIQQDTAKESAHQIAKAIRENGEED